MEQLTEIVRVNLNVPDELRQKWKIEAVHRNTDVTSMILDAMRVYLDSDTRDTVYRRTAQELDNLKKDWLADRSWGIEDAPGFGAHKDELLIYRLEQQFDEQCKLIQSLDDENQRLKKIIDLSRGLNCNAAIAQHLLDR